MTDTSDPAMLPGAEKAVWKRDPVTGRALPIAKAQDTEAHGKRGAMCKDWGKGFTDADKGPGCRCKGAGNGK